MTRTEEEKKKKKNPYSSWAIALLILSIGVIVANPLLVAEKKFDLQPEEDHNWIYRWKAALDHLSDVQPLHDSFRLDLKERITKGYLPLKGKTVLVTGGTKGLGKAIGAFVVYLGGDLIVLARSVDPNIIKKQVLENVQDIRSYMSTGNLPVLNDEGNIYIKGVQLDLGDMDKIDLAIKEVKSLNKKVDIVVSNAALLGPIGSRTKQGFEQTFAVNVIGSIYFLEELISHGILNNAITKARIIQVTSEDHRNGPDIFQVEKAFGSLGTPFEFGSSTLVHVLPKYDYSKQVFTMYNLAMARKHEKKDSFLVFDICPGPVGSEIATTVVPYPLDMLVAKVLNLLQPDAVPSSIPIIRLMLDEKLNDPSMSGAHFYTMKQIPARDKALLPKFQDHVWDSLHKLMESRQAPPASSSSSSSSS